MDPNRLTNTHHETTGNTLLLRYNPGVEVTVGRIVKDFSTRPSAEVIIDIDQRLAPERYTRRVFRGSLGLLSRSGIKGCVDLCKKRVTGIPPVLWEELIDDVADRALNNLKTRVVPKEVGLAAPKPERTAYQVWPMLPTRQPTLMWGASGIGKSWFAVYLSALVDNGVTINGLNADTGRTLYVDWECTEDVIAERAWAVKNGEPQIAHDWTLAYLEARAPLVDWIDDLAQHVAAAQFDFVVLDSVGLALGGSFNDDETVLAFFQALRQLEATTLLIDHEGKGQDAKERGAIGSSYKRHMSRSVWEMRQAEDGAMGFYHRKANGSKLATPFGLCLDIREDENHVAQSAIFTRCEVADVPELALGLTKAAQIEGFMANERLEKITPKEAADELGIDLKTAQRTLSRDFVKLERGTYGRLARNGTYQ